MVYENQDIENFSILLFFLIEKLTSDCNDINTICTTSNRIGHSTCVYSTITCSSTINSVSSTEHCTCTVMIHCSNTSGLCHRKTILHPCERVWWGTFRGTIQS